MRREQHIQMKFGQDLGIVSLQPRIDQQAGQMRIGDDLLDEAIAIAAIASDNAHREAILVEVFGLAGHVAAFFVEKTFPIADQELQVADLRQVDGGEVNLVNDAGGRRIPDATRSGIRGADDVLGAARPSRRDAWSSKGLGLVFENCHRGSSTNGVHMIKTRDFPPRWRVRPSRGRHTKRRR